MLRKGANRDTSEAKFGVVGSGRWRFGAHPILSALIGAKHSVLVFKVRQPVAQRPLLLVFVV